MTIVKIPLAVPIADHSGPVREIELRAPTVDEYFALGEPYELAETSEGARFAVQNPEVLRGYLEACLLKPSDPALLKNVGLPIARKIRRALIDFFQEGDGEPSGDSATSPTNSSSSPEPTSATSAA